MAFFSKDIGIDLGTANTLIYVKGKGIVLREPSVVAVARYSKEVYAVGYDAKEMVGKTPDNIIAIKPLKDGVISDYKMTYEMIKRFLHKVLKSGAFTKPRVVACVPSGVTEVERRAVEEAVIQSGAKEVYIVEESMAAAIGANLTVSEPLGNMVLDIGGGTSEAAVISLGSIVTAKTVRVAGNAFDEAIANYIKKKHNLLIGERTAEEIKIAIGSVYKMEDDEPDMDVRGRDNLSGLPRNIVVTSAEIREALSECAEILVDTVKVTLENTPPELSADIVTQGITLTGGGAFLKGLDRLLSERTLLPVKIAEDPLDCVAKGTGMVLDTVDTLRSVQGSAQKNKSRW
ncbi:MAG: rod shape-determining protein [Ruminococcaceae bacterium]|nr:rod shape-determining protein [Oscillospiraceae bacterium]